MKSPQIKTFINLTFFDMLEKPVYQRICIITFSHPDTALPGGCACVLT